MPRDGAERGGSHATCQFSGSIRNGLLALSGQPPHEWFAARLKAAFVGFGTADRRVCRILGTHDKADVRAIAAVYESKYGTPLRQAIRAECSGDYMRLALAWVELPDSLEQPMVPVQLPPPAPPPAEAEADAEVEVAGAVEPPTKKEVMAASARAKVPGATDETDDEEEDGMPSRATPDSLKEFRKKTARRVRWNRTGGPRQPESNGFHWKLYSMLMVSSFGAQVAAAVPRGECRRQETEGGALQRTPRPRGRRDRGGGLRCAACSAATRTEAAAAQSNWTKIVELSTA